MTKQSEPKKFSREFFSQNAKKGQALLKDKLGAEAYKKLKSKAGKSKKSPYKKRIDK